MLSRKFLAGLGLTEAQVEAIVEGNEDSIKGLKAQIDEHKTKEAELNEKIAGLQKEVEDAKASALEKEGKDPWKLKYDTLNEQFTAYKAEEEKKATKQKKEAAFVALLKNAGIAERRIASVCKVSTPDIDSIEFGEDGKVKDSETLTNKMKEEWKDFIETKETKPADVTTPPDNSGGKNTDNAAVDRIVAQRASLYGTNKA